jgi:hypothetical protein
MSVQFAVMQTAQGDRKLIAHFAAEDGWLGKLEVMGVGWAAAADQTGLLSHKPAMFLCREAAPFWRECVAGVSQGSFLEMRRQLPNQAASRHRQPRVWLRQSVRAGFPVSLVR